MKNLIFGLKNEGGRPHLRRAHRSDLRRLTLRLQLLSLGGQILRRLLGGLGHQPFRLDTGLSHDPINLAGGFLLQDGGEFRRHQILPMTKNATRKPRITMVSGSARKTSINPPISGRSAIAPAAAAPMRDCAHAVPIAPRPTAMAAARPSSPAFAPAGFAAPAPSAPAAAATNRTTASAIIITLRALFNLLTSPASSSDLSCLPISARIPTHRTLAAVKRVSRHREARRVTSARVPPTSEMAGTPGQFPRDT